MTTRRNLIKGTAGVGIMALGAKASAAERESDQPTLPSITHSDTRFIGTPLGGSLLRLHVGFDRHVVARHLGIDQDIDGSWGVWCDRVGPGDDDDRGAEGSIEIYDPALANFLEQLHALLVDPVMFGHQTIGRREAA